MIYDPDMTEADHNRSRPGGHHESNPATMAATVIPVRVVRGTVEILMLQRQRSMTFAGGAWVFPGGRVDLADVIAASALPRPDQSEPDQSEPDQPEPDQPTVGPSLDDAAGSPLWRARAERICACRECAEESGLTLDPVELRRLSHWTPPPDSPTRYSTAFFVAAAPHDAVRIDDESAAFRWIGPREALGEHHSGTFDLTPPTVVTLHQLDEIERSVDGSEGSAGGVATDDDVAARLLSAVDTRPTEHFATHIGAEDGAVVAMYHGDAGYEIGDATITGPRHRLVLSSDGWHYRRDAWTDGPLLPSVDPS